MPAPHVIIGESHEDKSSVEILIKALPTLAKLGYVLCLETPEDKNAEEFIFRFVEVRRGLANILKKSLPIHHQESFNPENFSFDQIIDLLRNYAPHYSERERELIAEGVICLPHDLALKNLVVHAKRLGMKIQGVDMNAEKLEELSRSMQGARMSEQSIVAKRDKAIAENMGRIKGPVVFLGGLAHIEGLEQLIKGKNKEERILSYCIAGNSKDIPAPIKRRFARTINLLKENQDEQTLGQIAIEIEKDIAEDIEKNTPQYIRARIKEIENEFKNDSGLSACKNASQFFFFHFQTYSDHTKNILKTQKSEFKRLVHTLARQQETPEARLAIYNEFKNSPVITTHRNGGLRAFGRTDSQIELDNEVDSLKNQITKKS